VRSRFADRFLILGYHRIGDSGGSPDPLTVEARNFEQQMATLARTGNVIPLRTAVARLERDDLPTGAVVITFDDGYADNLHVALPVLERYRLPATVFVVSDYLDREFWWDRLSRLMPAGNRVEEERLGEAVRKLIPMSDRTRGEALERLTVSVEAPPAVCCRALTPNELHRLASSPLIEIGAHTATHAALAKLPLEEQRREIESCRERLERLLSAPVRSLSYPHGSVSGPTAALVRTLGFDLACCSQPDVVTRRSDRFALPRFWIPDWSDRTFQSFLRSWGGA
jgi:peptidoglycan/xylan/chitin deacetylase (PgdA/CDA1 family)